MNEYDEYTVVEARFSLGSPPSFSNVSAVQYDRVLWCRISTR